MRRDSNIVRGPAAMGIARGPAQLWPTEADLWRISLDTPSDEIVMQLRELLSPDEEERASRFYFARDGRRFIVGRGVLRILLGRYLGRPPSDIVFHYGRNGKPQLAPHAGEPRYFNLAHSENLALYAFTRVGEVGIDVERVREMPEWESIASGCFTSAEFLKVQSAPPAEQLKEFFRAWTRQEALLKATGIGLGGTADVSSAPMRAGRPRSQLDPEPAYTDGLAPLFGWSSAPLLKVYALDAGEGFAAALAIDPRARGVTCFHWDLGQGLDQMRPSCRNHRLKHYESPLRGIEFL